MSPLHCVVVKGDRDDGGSPVDLVDDGLGVRQFFHVAERRKVSPADHSVQFSLQAALHGREVDHEEEEPPEVGRRRL